MPDPRKKVLVAMSGGVDSAVAAALLAREGFDVTGVFMCLGHAGGPAHGGCCSPTDAADARRAADALGLPLFVLNLADPFAPIIDDFVSQYARGRTPNPCVHCNSLIKFGRLLQRADELGIPFVATGHYARVLPGPAGPGIARAACLEKDQSYALFAVARSALSRILLPIGALPDKAAVRAHARDFNLSLHDKPDSQEICFVPDDDYTAVLAQRAPQALAPGPIVDSTGRILGRHDGYARFTIGQRRGLRVAAGSPMYVTGIDPATATVTIGPAEQLLRSTLSASGANWHANVLPGRQFRATVQIRYNHRGVPATVSVTAPDAFDVAFDAPVAAVTPGQAAVVYDHDRLLGGGWIN